MKIADIAELIGKAIENTIYKEWKHDGYIDVVFADSVNVVIDGKRYEIKISDYCPLFTELEIAERAKDNL